MCLWLSPECYTAPGAGKSLLWSVIIDGQLNRDPVASYGPPVIAAVQYPGGGQPIGHSGVRTDGNVTLHVLGANFGPPSAVGALVQYVRVQTPVQEVPVTSFTVLNHTTLEVVVPPGVGANLSLSVRVADQVSTSASTVAPTTFDYLAPVVSNLSSYSCPTTGCDLVVTGHNFGQATGASVDVVIGNPQDGSQSVRVATRAVYPAGDNGQPKVRPFEQVALTVPRGFGPGRAVQVLVYPSVYFELASSNDPIVDGAFLSYDPPVFAAVVTSLVTNGTADATQVFARFGPVSD